MSFSRDRFKDMLNDIAVVDGIRQFKKLHELTGIHPNTFTRIKRNEDVEVDEETFWKLNNAFGNRYNIKWFQGSSLYMRNKDYADAKYNHEPDIIPEDDRSRKIKNRAQEIQMSVLGHIINEPEVINGVAAEADPRPHLPLWADTLLGILSKQIAENEVLHAELKQSIADVTEMKQSLSNIIEKLNR